MLMLRRFSRHPATPADAILLGLHQPRLLTAKLLLCEVFHDGGASRAPPKPCRWVELDFPDHVDEDALVAGFGALVCEVEPADVVDVDLAWVGGLHQSSDLGSKDLFHGRHEHFWELAFPE